MVKNMSQEKVVELLIEILKWIKITSFPQVKRLLLEILPSDEEKVAFHYSDGRSSQQVADLAGVSYVTVTKWWKIWYKACIAEAINVRGGDRAKRIFSLEDFGIEVPQPQKNNIKQKETESIEKEAS